METVSSFVWQLFRGGIFVLRCGHLRLDWAHFYRNVAYFYGQVGLARFKRACRLGYDLSKGIFILEL